MSSDSEIRGIETREIILGSKVKSGSFNVSVSQRGGRGLKAHARAMRHMSKTKGYDIGWNPNSRYSRSQTSLSPVESQRINVSMIAKFIEFGFENQRSGTFVQGRPFFRYSNKQFHSQQMVALVMKYARANHFKRLRGGNYNLTAKQVASIGNLHAKRVSKTIKNEGDSFEGNTKFTKKMKGSGKPPLTDSGKMARTVTYALVPANGQRAGGGR